MRDQFNREIEAFAKIAPAAAVAFVDAVMGMPVEKWVSIATLIYVVLQVALLVRDRLIRRRRKTDGPE